MSSLRIAFANSIGKHNVFSVFLFYFDDFVERKEQVSPSHALIEFIDEKCTPVVPLQRLSGSLKQGEIVTVLWSNKMEYSACFLLSGKCWALVFIEIYH